MMWASILRVQDPPGNWRYKVTVRLRETGGVDMTVTHLQAHARYGSDIRGTASDSPMLPVSANSSGDAELFFPGDTRVETLSTLTVDMTVQFTDAHGNTGSVSNFFTCFDCWDY